MAKEKLKIDYLGGLVEERFDNIQFIKSVKCPVFFVHGRVDTVIKQHHSVRLHDECQTLKDIKIPYSMDHNNFDIDLDLILPFKTFFCEVEKSLQQLAIY